MGKNFKQTLKNEIIKLPMPEINETHLEETVCLSQIAFNSRRRTAYFPLYELIYRQLRFIAKPIWVLQGIILLAMCQVITKAMMEQAMVSATAFLSLSAVFTAMTILPFYGRARKYKMREIESATRISNSKLTLAKLCVIGSGDVICLSVISILFAGRMAEPVNAILAFVMMPFLLVSVGTLFILNRVREDYGIYISIAFDLGIGMLYWPVAMENVDWIIPLSTATSSVACILLFLVLIFECRRMVLQIPAMDLQESLMY